MVSTGIILGTISFVVSLWLWRRSKKMSVLQSLGIPCEPPNMWLGNIEQLDKLGFHRMLRRLKRKFGKTFGYYEGTQAVIVTSDVDVIKGVTVDHFKKFNARKPFPLDNPYSPHLDMFSARGEKWNHLRSITKPLFSADHINQMYLHVDKVANNLITVLEQRCRENKAFDILRISKHFTIDCLAKCVFGVEVNGLLDPQDKFLTECNKTMDLLDSPTGWLSFLHLFSSLFPGTMRALQFIFRQCTDFPYRWFFNHVKNTVNRRKCENIDRKDFIDLMLQGTEHVSVANDLSMELDHHGKNNADIKSDNSLNAVRKLSSCLTLQEMQGHSMLFILAGYETTSAVLAYACYELALHPEVQSKLHQEVDLLSPDQQDRTQFYDTIQGLEYLNKVVKETLRLHPIAQTATVRECIEECTIERVKFPKGIMVQLDMAAVHRDDQLWNSPTEFKPDRFKNGNEVTEAGWMPFGLGPRNCLGMNFAVMMVKVALVRLLRQYSLRQCPDTKVPLPKTLNSLQLPSEGVLIKILKRN